MRIFLVRHGQSQANVDHSVNSRVADHAIELTEEGHKQAQAAGEFLGDYLQADGSGAYIPRIRLWHSPYRRTRQTADRIQENAVGKRDFSIVAKATTGLWRSQGDSLFLDKREHMLLAEQQFGLFDGLSDEERETQFPKEQAYYEKCKAFEGKMWPKMPLGESRFEVCQRVHQAFGTFHRDADRHRIRDIVVVGHGTTNRAFVTMWLHKPWEWMHEEPNPLNCSIRLIEDGEDKGYIFKGFKGGAHKGQ